MEFLFKLNIKLAGRATYSDNETKSLFKLTNAEKYRSMMLILWSTGMQIGYISVATDKCLIINLFFYLETSSRLFYQYPF